MITIYPYWPAKVRALHQQDGDFNLAFERAGAGLTDTNPDSSRSARPWPRAKTPLGDHPRSRNEVHSVMHVQLVDLRPPNRLDGDDPDDIKFAVNVIDGDVPAQGSRQERLASSSTTSTTNTAKIKRGRLLPRVVGLPTEREVPWASRRGPTARNQRRPTLATAGSSSITSTPLASANRNPSSPDQLSQTIAHLVGCPGRGHQRPWGFHQHLVKGKDQALTDESVVYQREARPLRQIGSGQCVGAIGQKYAPTMPISSSRPMNWASSWASSLIARALPPFVCPSAQQVLGHRIRLHAGGSPASACSLSPAAAGLFGGTGITAPTAGPRAGSDRDRPHDRQGGLLAGPQLGYRRPNRRPSACAKPATARSLANFTTACGAAALSIQHVLGMAGPQQHRRAEQENLPHAADMRRLPGRRLDM